MYKLTNQLCVITSERYARHDMTHLQFAELAIKGGATMIQLRDKVIHDRALFSVAVALALVCKAYRVPLIINNRIDIAIASNADGVHLGQEDMPVQVARKMLGQHKIIGGSASSLEEAKALEKNGVDYIGFGHVFETKTKPKDYPPKGLDELEFVCGQIKVPIIAIGGISINNVEHVIAKGAAGVAVISQIAQADDPLQETKEMLNKIKVAAGRQNNS